MEQSTFTNGGAAESSKSVLTEGGNVNEKVL